MKKIMEKLNKHFFPCVVVLSLLMVLCTPLTVNAAWGEALDYADLDYSVQFGTDVNIVRCIIPSTSNMFTASSYNGNGTKKVIGKSAMEISTDSDESFDIDIFPVTTYGLSLANLPVGSKLVFEIEVDESGIVNGVGFHYVWKRTRYMDSSNKWLTNKLTDITTIALNTSTEVETFSLDYVIENIDGATALVPGIKFENYQAAAGDTLRLKVVSAYLEMEVSTEFWSQFQAQQNGKLLNDMVNGTPEQNAAADESVEEMEQASGKLDNLGDQLNSVEKPNADDMNVSADKLLGGMAATSMLTAPILEIWKNPVALSILTVVVTIVLISWVFFGKK